MTAEALHALVSQWPMEARPRDLDFAYGEWYNANSVTMIYDDAHAIALHEASGIRWLAEHAKDHTSMTKDEAGSGFLGWTVWTFMGEMFTAPTLIEALHAAIMATAKEQA
jgi:hypothetical protein